MILRHMGWVARAKVAAAFEVFIAIIPNLFPPLANILGTAEAKRAAIVAITVRITLAFLNTQVKLRALILVAAST